MSLLPFFQWCYATPIAETIRDSSWLFPVIEAVHLLGLGLPVGAVLMVEWRLLGAGMKQQPVSQLAANAEPWLLGAIAVMFASGIPLFMSEAIKAYYSFAFWVKMISLFLVLLYTFTLRRRLTRADAPSNPTVPVRFIAAISLALWFAV